KEEYRIATEGEPAPGKPLISRFRRVQMLLLKVALNIPEGFAGGCFSRMPDAMNDATPILKHFGGVPGRFKPGNLANRIIRQRLPDQPYSIDWNIVNRPCGRHHSHGFATLQGVQIRH